MLKKWRIKRKILWLNKEIEDKRKILEKLDLDDDAKERAKAVLRDRLERETEKLLDA